LSNRKKVKAVSATNMNEVQWSTRALRQVRKLPDSDRQRISEAAADLENMPNCRNVKTLKDHRYGYRLRVGRYRVLFDWDNIVCIVSVEEVRKRNERTY
jgi:mRNA-degrading endonuclease RelE of RelBE toxin-antitoxin system